MMEVEVGTLAGTGYEEGEVARKRLSFDSLDRYPERVLVKVPENIAPDFLKGLLAGSRRLFVSRDNLSAHYKFPACAPGIVAAALDSLYPATTTL